jgi:hypothetical protein
MFISTIFHKIKEIAFFIEPFLKNYRHFLPSGRADLTASASLQPIRSSSLQLHGLRPCRYSNLDS